MTISIQILSNVHYTALLQKNASFPIMYLWQQVKNLGKT